MFDLYEILVPKRLSWSPETTTAFTQALAEHLPAGGALHIIATGAHIRWIIESVEENNLLPTTMQSLVTSYYPGAEVRDPDDWFIDYPFARRVALFSRNVSHYFETFENVHMHRRQDPLSLVAQTMDRLEDGEVLTYSIRIHNHSTHTQAEIEDLLTHSAWERGDRMQAQYPYGGGGGLLGHALLEARKRILNQGLKQQMVLIFDERTTERYAAKLHQRLAVVTVSVTLETPYSERLQSLSDTIAAITNLTTEAPSSLAEGRDESAWISNQIEDEALWDVALIEQWMQALDANPNLPEPFLFLTPDELASLWHLPHEQFTASRIQWADVVVPLPEPLRKVTDGVRLGRNNGYQVWQPTEERTQHTIIAGKPGVGKSTAMELMIAQDIKQGRGLVVADPHGSLVQHVLRYHIPEERENDVVVLDFAQLDHPAPLNPLARPDNIATDVSTGMVMAVMTKLYDDFAFREMSDTLHVALMTLAADPGATLLDIHRLFDDVEYHDELAAKLDDFPITAFWNRFDGLSWSKQNEMTRPVLRRLNTFYRNKALRAIACHPQPLNLRQLVAENKIILISLAADEAKMPAEQRQLLGAALVSQIQMAAMAGAITQSPFLLYIDEAQNFVTSSLSDMLSEARKQGLGLVLANQYLKQLAGDTLDAVEGTVSTMIAFEVGDADAKAFTPYMKPQFQAADLVSLGKFRAAVSMRHQAMRQPAFTLETLAPPQPANEHEAQLALEREAYLRQKSIENYTPMTYSEVDDWLRKRYSTRPDDDPTLAGDGDGNFFQPG